MRKPKAEIIVQPISEKSTGPEINTTKNEIKKKKKESNSAALIIGAVLIFAAGVFFMKKGINAGAKAFVNSYQTAYESEKESAYDKLYQKAYERAEKNYHVSNTVVISIGKLEKTQKLEVLKVSDNEICTDKFDASGNVTAWMEGEGEGTFVVDLQAAEYIIDNEHKYILVRIPKPELSNITIKKARPILLVNDGFKNGSYMTGTELAMQQRNKLNTQIERSLQANQYIHSRAQDISKSMVKNLIKQFNPDIPDLQIDVEFLNTV